jgi:hypothetical protein
MSSGTTPAAVRPSSIRRRTLHALVAMLAAAAMLLGLVPGAHGTNDSNGDELDLMFLLDGSGSISPSQWTLQKEGLAAALRDTIAFPLDGSRAVGVVQWSYVSDASRTRLELPLTELSDRAAREAFIGELLAIPQIGRLTNPGDGIRMGTDHLVAAGREDADRYLCLSTDGTTNSGESLSSAVAHAQANDVDRLSVVALEDPPWFDAQTAHVHYGPHVYGGGTVTFARNVPEFASLIVGGCVNPALELVGLEVNQAVQDWNGSVPLVAGKSTVVRAFVQIPDGGDQVTTTGRLFAYRNGVELPGSPISHTQRGGGPVIVDEDVVARRNVLSDSLNFRIPREWTNGSVTFEVEVGGGLSCMESAPPASTCTVEAAFQDTGELSARFVGVTWWDGTDLRTPSWFELLEQAQRTRDVMAVGNMPFRHGEMLHGDVLSGDTPDLSDVIRRLDRRRRWDCFWPGSDCEDFYYGVLVGTEGGGLAYRPGNAGAGFMDRTTARSDGGHPRNRVGHEIYHNLGQYHPVDSSLGLDSNGRLQGYCREEAPASAPDFPHFHDVGGNIRPTLGPMLQTGTAAARDREVWGLAPRFVPHTPRLGLIDPYTTFALMGYCRSSDQDGQGRWVSQHTYRQGFQHFRTSSTAVPGTRADADEPLILVGGRIDLDTDRASFDPVLPLPDGVPDPVTAGDYVLELRGAGGIVLAEVPFDPRLVVFDSDDEEHEHPEHDVADFLLAVRNPGPQLYELAVRRGDSELGSFSSGPTAPVVTVTEPAEGEVLDGERVTFRWDGHDADGDALTYAVAYSPDDGATWDTLAVDVADSELTLDRFWLEASESARILVAVSDGIRTTTAVSPMFAVAGSAPRVAIEPDGHVGNFYGMQPVVLHAHAIDAGGWSIEAISWHSDRDGPLGSGPELHRVATDLSEGDHVITATAAGASGLTGSATVELTIGRIPPPPEEREPPAPPTAHQQLQSLIALVRSYDLDRGTERSLLAKLESSANALDADLSITVCNRLRAFGHQVEALSDKRLESARVDELLDRSARLRGTLECLADDG